MIKRARGIVLYLLAMLLAAIAVYGVAFAIAWGFDPFMAVIFKPFGFLAYLAAMTGYGLRNP